MIQRTIERITRGAFHKGFLGEGHSAAAVVDGSNFSATDPFIILMDDRLNLPGGQPVGGAHPHAGFETVTLVLKGDDKHWKTGTLEVMTAGKGIVHTEEMTDPTDMHILQLWLALPQDKRWVAPRWQELQAANAPTYKTDKVTAIVYSGSSNRLTSPMQNYTPLTLVDFSMAPSATVTQEIPTSYNGFAYVIEGQVQIGDKVLAAGDAGWLNNTADNGMTELVLRTNDHNARVILYAAQPHGAEIVSHGPFIGDSREDIVRLYHEYNKGQMPHLNDLDESVKVRHVNG